MEQDREMSDGAKQEKIVKSHPGLFNSLGRLKDYTYQIVLKPEFKLVCLYTSRNVPLPLREKRRQKPEDMASHGVISTVDRATDWCSGMVP